MHFPVGTGNHVEPVRNAIYQRILWLLVTFGRDAYVTHLTLMVSIDHYIVAKSLKILLQNCFNGRGSFVVKVMDLWSACHELKARTSEDSLSRGPIHVKYDEQMSSHWCGAEVRRRGGASSGEVLVT
ncbi:hypothetical protein TNCV_921771 [Trichonephila clavipes]|nr:hypothetical protein TNCV_921771 [Trichonephila clavipes]